MRTQQILTQRGVEVARPKAKRYGRPDGSVPGLRLIILSQRREDLCAVCAHQRPAGQFRIGSAAVLTLANARAEARRSWRDCRG